MMVRVLLILFCLLFAGHSFSIEGIGYNYDVITTLSEEVVDSYDGRSNYIAKCGICDIENSSEKTRDGSFFVFEVALVVAKRTRFGPMNLGPLDDAAAATFRGSSYTATTLGESTTLYRVYGGSAGKLGSYWTRTKPSGPLQSQLDSALAPQWGNTAQNVVSIKVPRGTTIYEGAAASQPTGVGKILGGGNQVFIPKVNPNWIQ